MRSSSQTADPGPRPAVVERVATPRGELVLRRAGDHYEIIRDGVFLMDTRNGRSERALVETALEGRRSARLLIGGLGVGFSLQAAVSSPAASEIVVVEIERAVVRWCGGYLRRKNGDCLSDARVRLVRSDFVEYLRRSSDRFDAICLDVDNGPDWLSAPENAVLYSGAGLRELAWHLLPGGALAVWSFASSKSFAVRLQGVFRDVAVLAFPVDRGTDDVIYLARVPSRTAAEPRAEE
jgi:spermidine synthase